MKKILITVMILAIAAAVGFWYWNSNLRNEESRYITTQAAVQELKQTVEATGSVASADQVALSFKNGGRIQTISVEIGSQVRQGDVVATVSDSDLRAQIDRARAAVLAARADLAKLNAGATAEQIAVSAEQGRLAKTALSSAEKTLQNLTLQHAQKQEQYRATALQNLSDTQLVLTYTMDVVFDSLLDSEASTNFQTTQSVALNSARTYYDRTAAHLDSARSLAQTAGQSRDRSDIHRALSAMSEALANASGMIDRGLAALSGAIVNTTYSKSTIDSFKTSFNARSTAISAEKTAIQSSITDFTVNIEQLNKELDDQSFRVETAQRESDLQDARHKQLLAPPQEYDIQKLRALIAQAEAEVANLQSRLPDSSILAPLNGTVTKVDLKVGEIASPSQQVMIMIGGSALQIDVDIPESDITKVSVGQRSSITLDSLGSDTILSGAVSFIEPSERTIQGVIYYRVTVLFTEQHGAVKPGMTATVRIQTAERQNALSVPLRAVRILPDGSKTVRVLHGDDTVETRSVMTGIRADDGAVEILDGLSEGERVITGELSR